MRILILIAVILTSCGPSREELNQNPKKYGSRYPVNMDVLTIDSCEYILYERYTSAGVSACVMHKANCKNHTK